jgi:hypothetical protein
MDRTGETRHNFDAKNADALLKAEQRFKELIDARLYRSGSYRVRRGGREAHLRSHRRRDASFEARGAQTPVGD